MSRAPRPAAAAAVVIVTWAVILGVVVGVGWLLTHQLRSSVEPWDDDVSRWFADQRTPTLTSVSDVGTFLGETRVGWALAALGAVAFSLWRRTWLPAVFMGLAAAGSGGFYFIATHVDPRQRPPVKILDPGLVPDHSFPSGHVATAVGAYGGLLLLAWVYSRAARPWVWLLVLLPVLVLLARLYQGAHHLTDVATSVAYASAWLAVLARAVLAHATPGRAEGPVSSAP
jgi:undecaprenyl-diphosphatase